MNFFSSHWVIFFVLIFTISVVFSAALFFFVRKRVHFKILQQHHEFAGLIITVVGALYSVFLGFTIVNSQEHYSQIIAKVNKEAYLSADLYRLAEAFPEQTKNEMQEGIRAYVKSIINDEWPLMYLKKESPLTLDKLEKLWKPIRAINPKNVQEQLWFSETLRILFNFNNARLERIYSSWDSLGLLSWMALIGGGVILISFLFFFGTQNAWSQMVINSLFIGFIVFMICIVYLLDNPFRGPQMIHPKAYQVVNNYYEKARGQLISPEDTEALRLLDQSSK